jgi:hypothetical protein
MNPNIRTGTYTGNTAAQNIILGFVPDYVRVINITDGTTAWEWFKGMTNGHAFQNTNHDTAQNSVISSNGISPYAGTSGGNGAGFTIGTALSTDTKVFRYVAMRSGAGAA